MEKWTIYYISSCPYCKNALNTLQHVSCLKKIDIGSFSNIPTIFKMLQEKGLIPKKYNKYTVPIIFRDNFFIGGYTELIKCLPLT